MESHHRYIVSVAGVSKRFASNVIAVDDVSVDIREGEFFALLGPSGCGKTTLLRMIAGFELPTTGRLLIDGNDMADVPPNRRPVNMVFQSYAVFPHMTVARNVAYGLKVSGVPKAETASRVEEALALVQLTGLESRMPAQLSGGQRQRVALARALVKKPRVLLLDEPLSALDAKLREAMRLELVRLQHSVGITFIIVTHDQSEALSMADRVAVMDKGRVLQVASPSELYEYPNCRFVADFIGQMNLFQADVVEHGDGKLIVDVSGLEKSPLRVELEADSAPSGEVGVAIRPEKVSLDPSEPAQGRVRFAGVVTEVAYYGNESRVFLQTPAGTRISASVQNRKRDLAQPARVGDTLWVSWPLGDTLLFEE